MAYTSFFSLTFILISLFVEHESTAAPSPSIFENSGQFINSDQWHKGAKPLLNDTQTDPFLKQMIDFIEKAEKTLTMEVYGLRHDALKQAILEALHRGVRVQIVMEADPVGSGCDGFSKVDKNEKACYESRRFSDLFEVARLQRVQTRAQSKSGIRFFNKKLCWNHQTNTEVFCYQHGKLMIRDRSAFLLSTGNFNESNLCSQPNLQNNSCYRDLSTIIHDKKAASALEDIVALDYSVASECKNPRRFIPNFKYLRRPSESRCADNDPQVDPKKHLNKIQDIIKHAGLGSELHHLTKIWSRSRDPIESEITPAQTVRWLRHRWVFELLEILKSAIRFLPGIVHRVPRHFVSAHTAIHLHQIVSRRVDAIAERTL